jgi:hypothetical protein
MTEGPTATKESELLEFQKHYDSRLDNFGVRLGKMETKLSGEMGEIRALLTSALKNQDGVFTRLNRPVAPLIIAGFAVVISLVSVFITFMNLTVNPIKDDITHIEKTMISDEHRQREIHMMLNQRQFDDAVITARLEENIKWLERMEERLNSRLHRGLTQ